MPSLQDSLFVSAGKAAVASLARWVLPLTVDVPPQSDDVCTDLAALRAAITRTAKQERRLFWMHHVGSIAANAAGAAILLLRGGSVSSALASAGVGWLVGLLSTYTMPRSSWHLWRTHDWYVAAAPQRDGAVLTIGGAF